MKISELSRSLGISRQMTYRLKNQGMPTDSLEAAIAWRKRNIDPFRSKMGRIGGNTGVKYQPAKVNESVADTLIINSIIETLTHIIPSLWFEQIGWLGGALKDHGVKITTEQLIKVQALLFYVYMSEVDEFLKTENQFKLPDALMAKPGDKNYSYLIESLNKTLSQEPMQLYES